MTQHPTSMRGPAPEPGGPDRGPDLKAAALAGMRWKGASQVVAEGTRVVVAIVVARTLTPADYGVAAIALVVASFVTAFTTPAFSTAIVRQPDLSEEDRSTVFWVTVGIGAVTTILGVALSGTVAAAFGQPRVADLFRVLSLTFLLNSLASTQSALLARELAYRRLQIRQIAATLLGGGLAVALALAGYGPWAIVANSVGYAALASLLVWLLSPWRPRRVFSRRSLRELGGFGSKLFGVGMLAWGNQNVDNVLVGRVLGARALGAYSLAYNVMFLPMERIGIPVQQVIYPVLARMQDDPARLERVWLQGKRLLVAVTAPMYLGALVVAPDLIHVAFGARWNAAVAPLELLCVAGIAHAVETFNSSVLVISGKTGVLLRITLIGSPVTLAAFAGGVEFGIVGVAGFYAAAKWLLVPLNTGLTTRALSFGFGAALRAGLETLPIAAVAAGLGLGARVLLEHGGVPAAARLVLVALVLGGTYLLLLRAVRPAIVSEVVGLLRRRPAAEPALGGSA